MRKKLRSQPRYVKFVLVNDFLQQFQVLFWNTFPAFLFPSMNWKISDQFLSLQMVLAHIKWPTPNPDSDDDENDVSVEAVTRVTAFFRTFIEHGMFCELCIFTNAYKYSSFYCFFVCLFRLLTCIDPNWSHIVKTLDMVSETEVCIGQTVVKFCLLFMLDLNITAYSVH